MQKLKITFSEVQRGENFRRADGINGMSYDKVSAKKARPCCLANDMKPVEFAPDFKVWVLRSENAKA